MKIGLIDSGIGGLTVLSSLLKECPNHEYIYFGDTIHLPYGDKTKEQIIEYGNNIIKFLESKYVDIIVIACGTLSSNKEFLKSNVPLIDIISPLKNRLDHYKNISVIATPLSVKINEFQKYIQPELNLIACPKLVPIIEKRDNTDLDLVLNDYLKSATNSDALILGCTHYPLIIEHIKKYFNKDIICLDKYIVEIVKKYPEGKNSLKIYFSALNEELIANTKKILNKENLDIESVSL